MGDALTPGTLWTVRDLARFLNVHERTVARWVRFGRLPCVRIGSRLRFDRQDVLRWVAARKEGAELPKLPRGMFRRKVTKSFYTRVYAGGREVWRTLGTDYPDAWRKLRALRTSE